MRGRSREHAKCRNGRCHEVVRRRHGVEWRIGCLSSIQGLSADALFEAPWRQRMAITLRQSLPSRACRNCIRDCAVVVTFCNARNQSRGQDKSREGPAEADKVAPTIPGSHRRYERKQWLLMSFPRQVAGLTRLMVQAAATSTVTGPAITAASQMSAAEVAAYNSVISLTLDLIKSGEIFGDEPKKKPRDGKSPKALNKFFIFRTALNIALKRTEALWRPYNPDVPIGEGVTRPLIISGFLSQIWDDIKDIPLVNRVCGDAALENQRRRKLAVENGRNDRCSDRSRCPSVVRRRQRRP